MTQHVMVDLETLGTDLNSVIVAIGAVKFDTHTCIITDQFYVPVDPESCQKIGMVIDANTVWWWMHPDRAAAREALLRDEHREDIVNALGAFATWYGVEPLPIWGNGCMFDNQILEFAYERTNQTCPWTYRDNRDYRTFRNLLGARYQEPPKVLAHHALEDAKWQAQHLMNILKHNNLDIG